MTLETHAKEELELAGLFDKDSDYDGMIGTAVMELIKVFSKQGHSGFSAMQTLSVFDIVARFKPLTPITNNPKEWMEVGEKMWQSNRKSTLFSTDGGKTHYDIDVNNKPIKTTIEYEAK